MTAPQITISIVSHRQNGMVNRLLADIGRFCADSVQLILTENVPDVVALDTSPLRVRSEIVCNASPKGFGANHNAAFAHCGTPFFCVCNPDIHLDADPFEPVLAKFDDCDVGVVGPLVFSPAGAVEDSARHFPTMPLLLRKLVGVPLPLDYPVDRGCVAVEWVAGMFMVFRAAAYRAVRGFDEAYYLYYEDVDICRRLHEQGWSVVYEPGAHVVHAAQRASRKDRHLAMRHLASMMRYLKGPRPSTLDHLH